MHLAAPPGLVPPWGGDTVASWWQGRRTLEAAVPAGIEEELLIGPLVSDHGTCGWYSCLQPPGSASHPSISACSRLSWSRCCGSRKRPPAA